jgi:hypothetical protein
MTAGSMCALGATADCLECNGQHIHGPKKAARRRLLSSTLLMVDHAAINAGFDLRRYVMKPIPAKPRSSVTEVDGCGNCRDSCARWFSCLRLRLT